MVLLYIRPLTGTFQVRILVAEPPVRLVRRTLWDVGDRCPCAGSDRSTTSRAFLSASDCSPTAAHAVTRQSSARTRYARWRSRAISIQLPSSPGRSGRREIVLATIAELWAARIAPCSSSASACKAPGAPAKGCRCRAALPVAGNMINGCELAWARVTRRVIWWWNLGRGAAFPEFPYVCPGRRAGD